MAWIDNNDEASPMLCGHTGTRVDLHNNNLEINRPYSQVQLFGIPLLICSCDEQLRVDTPLTGYQQGQLLR